MPSHTAVDALKPPLRIDGNTRANLTLAWTFTVLWNIVSVPLLFIIPSELDGNRLAAIGFLFPIVGVGLLVWAVLTTLRWRRFGQSWFEITTSAETGRQLAGTIHVRLSPPAAPEASGVLVKLTCLQRTIRRGSDGSESSERILWREEAQIPVEGIAFGAEDAAVPVRFAIPADAHETTVVGRSEGVFWVLSAEARVPGVDLREEFDVPVSKGSVAAVESFASARNQRSSHVVTLDDLAKAGITVLPSGEGTTYHFRAMRNPSFASGVTAFTALWTGALWLQIALGFPRFFTIVTALVELLLVVIAIDLWFGATSVTIGSGMVRWRHTILGVGSTQEIPFSEIAQIELPITMQTSGRSGTPYYELRAKRRNGRKKSLGGGIRDKRQAEWLAQHMREAIGLRV